MRKEAGLTTLFTFAAGAIGLFIRWLQLSTIFEVETGLAVRGSAPTIALVITIIFYAAALFIIVRGLKNAEKKYDYRGALRGRSIVYPAVAAALGAATIIAAIIMFVGASQEARPNLWRIISAAALLCGVSYPLLALGPGHSSKGALTCVASVFPTMLFCIWLVGSYMLNAENPTIWAYATVSLATAGAVLGFYYYAGYAFGKPRPLSTLYFSHLGAFFCIVTIADTHSFPAQIMFASAAVMLLILASTLVGNFKKPRHSIIED